MTHHPNSLRNLLLDHLLSSLHPHSKPYASDIDDKAEVSDNKYVKDDHEAQNEESEESVNPNDEDDDKAAEDKESYITLLKKFIMSTEKKMCPMHLVSEEAVYNLAK